MIVFQVKGQSHRLSTLSGKEKDVIKKFPLEAKLCNNLGQGVHTYVPLSPTV